MHLKQHAIVHLYTDNLPFAEANNKGEGCCRKKHKCKCIYQLFSLIKEESLHFSVWRLPSHLADEPHRDRSHPTPEWVSQHHIWGNQHADRLAALAAKLYAIEPESADPIIKNTKFLNKYINDLPLLYATFPIENAINFRNPFRCLGTHSKYWQLFHVTRLMSAAQPQTTLGV